MTWTKPQENCQLSSITCQSYWFTKHIVTIFISFYSLFIVSHRPNSSLGIAPTSPLGTTSHIGGASHSNIETARPAWRVSSVLRCRCNFCWEKTKAFIWHTVKHPLRTDVLFIRWSDLFFHQQDIGKGTSIWCWPPLFECFMFFLHWFIHGLHSRNIFSGWNYQP